MCLCTYLPKGVELDFEKVRRAFHSNSDGWGIMALGEDNSVYTEKSLGNDYTSFMEVYKKFKGLEKAVHFRTRTHGLTSIDNCHPIFIKPNSYLMHNGCITNLPHDPIKSDSFLFAEGIAAAIDRNCLGDEKFVQLLESVVGSNKLIFLNDGKFTIINKSKGTEEKDGTWYSNSNYFYSIVHEYEEDNYYNAYRKPALFQQRSPVSYLDPIYLPDGFKLILEEA